MTRPSLVIFDMDDVLCHYNLGKRLRYLADLAGTTARDVRAALWDSEFEAEADAGNYANADAYLAGFSQRLGFPLSRAQWVEARRLAMIPNTDVLAIAKAIGNDAALAVFTNNGPLVKEHFAELFPEAALIFPTLYCSYEFDAKKPDPQSFLRLLEKLNRDPAACWFIDDKRSNVEGARIAGLRGHHFRHASLLAEEAIELGFHL